MHTKKNNLPKIDKAYYIYLYFVELDRTNRNLFEILKFSFSIF